MKKNISRYWLLCLIVLGGAAAATLAIKTYLEAFKLANITMDLTLDNLQWQTPYETKLNDKEKNELLALLDQPFSYLGSGNQVYAFVSQDGLYVLKFFKFGHLKPNNWNAWLPYGAHREAVKLRKIDRLFRAHAIAYRWDRQHTGLLYVHTSNHDDFLPTITVRDRYGFTQHIPLNTTFFVLQKKGTPLREVIHTALQKGNIAQGKQLLHRVIEMYLDEYRLGVCDQDHNLWYNVGFVGDEPIRMDVGKVTYDPSYANPAVHTDDLVKVIQQRIAGWLQKYHPNERAEIVDDLTHHYLYATPAGTAVSALNYTGLRLYNLTRK